jgi:hypothetical protein
MFSIFAPLTIELAIMFDRLFAVLEGGILRKSIIDFGGRPSIQPSTR